MGSVMRSFVRYPPLFLTGKFECTNSLNDRHTHTHFDACDVVACVRRLGVCSPVSRWFAR